MKRNEKHSFDRLYFDNRWKRHKYSRPCDWTIIGISVRWAGPEDYCYSISLFGFSLRIWMKRTFINKPITKMRKLIIAVALIITASTAIAQTKPKEEKPVYKKVVVLDVSDIQTCMQALNKWRELEPYSPSSTDQEKIATVKSIDTYIADLVKRVKIDSVKVEPEKVNP